MATCEKDKFIVDKSMSNEFILTIKQDSSTLPMVIESTDTFELKLIKLKDDFVAGSVTLIPNSSGSIEIENAANGKLKVILSDELVNTLETNKGDRADYYYAKALYRIAIDCNTTNNGNFVARIEQVYVR